MNPWRSVMMVELGERVVQALMSEDDWVEIVEIVLDQMEREEDRWGSTES